MQPIDVVQGFELAPSHQFCLCSLADEAAALPAADYGIDLVASTTLANVTRADPAGCAAQLSCFNVAGSAPITVGTDSMQVTVPLSLLGNADGRMAFAMNAYVLVATATAVVFDVMPDANQSPARVQ